MSKLLIPNTTQVPNVLLDVVMRRVSDPGLRVLLAIIRKTYGFQKESDRVSLTQLEEMTGLSRQGVVNGKKALGSIVLTVRHGGREGNEYSLNLNIATGELVNAVDQSTGLTSQRSGQTTSQRGRHTKPNKNKTNIGAFASDASAPNSETQRDDGGFEAAWAAYPKRAGGNSKRDALKAWTARVRAGVAPSEMAAGVERYARYIRATGKEGSEYVKQTATFFGPAEHWKEAWNIPARANGGRSAGGFAV